MPKFVIQSLIWLCMGTGLHYLDAPTPYIMGINKSSNITASYISVGCFIDCDQNTVDVNVDPHLLIVPPFVDSLKHELEAILNSDLRLSSRAIGLQKSAALKRMTDLAKKHNVINDSFDCLDDSKLNQQIRVVFLKTIRKHILHKYQQFIITSSNKKVNPLFCPFSQKFWIILRYFH